MGFVIAFIATKGQRFGSHLVNISALFVCAISALFMSPTSSAIGADPLEGLRKQHPRLFFTNDMGKTIRERAKKDPKFREVVQLVTGMADKLLDSKVVEGKKKGERRMLGQVRWAFTRLSAFSAAYRITGKKKYLLRAEKEMLAASNLSNWNPSHFLDVAEMCAGLAIAYDWLYEDLSEETRATVRKAIIEKGLKLGFGKKQGFHRSLNNWNQVCHGGLLMAALAIADDEPDWARKVVTESVKNVKRCMINSFYPMGVYPEGPDYWSFGTTYNVMLISALESALGHDFELSKVEGFLPTALYRVHTVGPDGKYYAYSDCGSGGKHIESAVYWFARRQKRLDIAQAAMYSEQHIWSGGEKALSMMNTGWRFLPLLLAWYTPFESSDSFLDLDYLGQSANPVASFRSSWSKDANWLAIKGGNNRNSHCHMDAGSFVIMAGGVRWADDLIRDSYAKMEKLGNIWKGRFRYTLFRYGLQGHSTLILNNKDQSIDDSASVITSFYSSPKRSSVIIDMSRPWRKEASSVRRGAAFINKRSYLIQDEVKGCKGEILWQMMTVKDLTIDGSKAVMQKDGKKFIAQILAPEGATFSQLSVKPKNATENQNEEYSKLGIRLKSDGKLTTIAVNLSLDEGGTHSFPKVIPLDQWPGDSISVKTSH